MSRDKHKLAATEWSGRRARDDGEAGLGEGGGIQSESIEIWEDKEDGEDSSDDDKVDDECQSGVVDETEDFELWQSSIYAIAILCVLTCTVPIVLVSASPLRRPMSSLNGDSLSISLSIGFCDFFHVFDQK